MLPTTSVCPALCPPWKRTTASARLASQSTILPLPSSPHWAPITVTLAKVSCSFYCTEVSAPRPRGEWPQGQGESGPAGPGRTAVPLYSADLDRRHAGCRRADGAGQAQRRGGEEKPGPPVGGQPAVEFFQVPQFAR